jgi:signal peptidase I
VTSPFPPPAGPSATPAEPSAARRSFGCVIEVIETLVLTILIFFIIQTFVAQPYQVRQQSMERTLEPNEYVLVDKLTPRWDDYKRGDIVVFEPPSGWSIDGDRTPFIKRVIGVGGDTVDLRDGRVFVNDVELDEPYVYTEPDGEPQPTDPTGGRTTWSIPPGEVFVMGDHRQASADSRTFGSVPLSSVLGRAWLRYWPLSAFGILRTPTYEGLEPEASSSAPLAAPLDAPLEARLEAGLEAPLEADLR